MKKFALLSVLSICFGWLHGQQQQPCATEMPEEMINWLKAYKQQNPGAPALKTSDDFTLIPIKFHNVGNDQGAGYYRVGDILDDLCTLNEQYEPYGWKFYIYEGINYINSTDLNDHDNNYWVVVGSESVPNTVNIFYVSNPNGACGYYSGWGGPQNPSGGGRQGYIAISKSCGGRDNSTVAHEIGHFFSLPHTFYGWEGRNPLSDAARSTDERVNGSNCGFAGDYFCDTPADFYSDRWRCPFSVNKLDYNGDPYEVDGKNYMSYSNDDCTEYFSNEQVDAMKAYLRDVRDYLEDHTVPVAQEITDTVETVYPAVGAQNIPVNYAQLKWNSVPGATFYHVQATKNASGLIMDIDTVVEGSSLLIQNGLLEGVLYRWRVRAFNEVYTCSPYTIYSTFTTGAATALNPVANIVNPSCGDSQNGSIGMNVTGGTGPYNYFWSDGSVGANINGLAAGSYLVTIQDVNSDSLVISYNLLAPQLLDVEFDYNGTSVLQTTISGGVQPYLYNWSDGGTDPFTNLQGVAADYTLTVTDANGCQAVKTFVSTGIENVGAITNVSMFPNPSAGRAVTLAFSTNEAFNGALQVYNSTGQLIYNQANQYISGNNQSTIPTVSYTSGVYFVRVVADEVLINRKLVVIE